VETFHICAADLEGAVPVLTAEKMHILLSLRKTFGFIGLLSQVPDFISSHSVVEDAVRKKVSDSAEEKLQMKQALCLPQEVLSRPDGHEKEQRALNREIAGLREAQARTGRKDREFRVQLAQAKQRLKDSGNGPPSQLRYWSPGWSIWRVVQQFFGCGMDPLHRKIRWMLRFLASTLLRLIVRIGLTLISDGTIKDTLKFMLASSS
jgi:hypothetical protein